MQDGASTPLNVISEAWRERWLLGRVRNPVTVTRLALLGPSTIGDDLLPIDATGQYLLAFGEWAEEHYPVLGTALTAWLFSAAMNLRRISSNRP